MLIAPRRSGFGRRAKGRGRTRRNDDGGLRMTVGDSLARSVLVLGSVRREQRDGIGDRADQSASSGGVIDVLSGQFDGDDLDTPSQCRIIFRPVRDPIARLPDVMTVLGVVFERHGRFSDSESDHPAPTKPRSPTAVGIHATPSVAHQS